ncbi:MAG: alpha/beta hydrolase [Pedobacter sp.]|nr:MAG: alpha/beta hydrolase [Pedobacter sp.]
MKTYFIGTFLLTLLVGLHTQSHAQDTSFTTYSAYKKALKGYPDIKIVPERTSAHVKEERNVTYCKVGDRELKLDAFYPVKKSLKNLPAIVIIHGGGWRSGNRAQHIPLAQHLAAMGYACFTVGYRLSEEALYPAGVTDVKSAIRWIKRNNRRFKVDVNKVTALGFSAGGQMAVLTGVTSGRKEFDTGCLKEVSDEVQAIVDIDGTLSFVHPESGEGDDSKKPSAATLWFGVSKVQNPSLWVSASPLTYAGKDTPPILLINSSIDRMHAGRNDFIAKLNEAKVYSEVHTCPDSPHAFCLFDL